MTKKQLQIKSLEALIEDLETNPCDQTFKSLHYRALSLVADLRWKELSYMNMRLLLVDKQDIDEKFHPHFIILTETIQKFQTYMNTGLDLYEEALQIVNDEDLHTLLLALNHSGTMEYEKFKMKTSGMSNIQFAVSRANDHDLIQIIRSDKVQSVLLTLKGRKMLTIIDKQQHHRNNTDG